MGCDSYTTGLRMDNSWDEVVIHFSESDDDYCCLCTFPHNYTVNGVVRLDKAEVRSFAALGAMVALAHAGKLENRSGYAYIPDDLPLDIRSEIDRVVGDRAP